MSYKTLNVLRVIGALACFAAAGRYVKVHWSTGDFSYPFVILLTLGVLQLVLLDWACWTKDRCRKRK